MCLRQAIARTGIQAQRIPRGRLCEPGPGNHNRELMSWVPIHRIGFAAARSGTNLCLSHFPAKALRALASVSSGEPEASTLIQSRPARS